MTRIFILIFLLSSIYGFATDKIKSIKVGEALNNKEEVKLSQFGKSIKYFVLGEGDVYLPGQTIANICISDNKILFIPIGQPEYGIYKFDLDGKLISCSINRGRHESEFYQISASAVSPRTGDILLLEYDRILKIDVHGNYVGSIQLNDKFENGARYVDIIFDGDSNFILLWHGRDYIYKATGISMDGKVIFTHELGYASGYQVKNIVINGKKVSSRGLFKACLFNDNEVCFTSEILDIIYSLDKGKKSVKYKLDWGNRVKSSLIDNALSHRMPSLIPNLDIKNIHSPNLLFFDFTIPPNMNPSLSYKERRTGVLYNKIKDISYSPAYDSFYESFGLTNDIDGGAPFWPKFMTKKKMYQIIDAIDFIEMAEKSTSARMKEVASQLTEESNPVVVEVTLK